MARTYTYEDFERALQASGLAGKFSDADMQLARKNPDAGMSILSYKQDYENATTDELRALANAGAESVRSSFGEYTGGGSGSGYKITQMSPGGFEYDREKPVYEDRYGSQVEDLMSEIMKQNQFEYDPETDPLYSSYKKTYTREGKRATADALGEAATMTGGIPSSYAMSAASQAGNYYASQLADKVPELYQMAYSKYMDDYSKRLDRLQMLQDREQFEYSKYLDEVTQYENDKAFDYGKWLDEIESQANERTEAISKAKEAAEYGDYSLLEQLGITPDYALLEQMRNAKSKREGESVTPEVTEGMPESLAAVLQQAYPDGVITNEKDWNELVEVYGEDGLAEMGYKKGEAAISEETASAMENDLAAFMRLMQIGDEDVKTGEDIKNAMMEAYPEYVGNETFLAWLDENVSSLDENKPETTEEKAKNSEKRKQIESGRLPLNWKER